MENSTEDKVSVAKGIFTAWVFSIGFISCGYWLSRENHWFNPLSNDEILMLALLPSAFALLLGIGWAARTRHFNQNIDGSAPAPGTSLDITLRYIQNTLEQIVLFALASFCLMTSAPEVSRTVLPILGIWFFIARMMFWAGYKRGPLSRAIGFASTFHTTIAMLAVSTGALLF